MTQWACGIGPCSATYETVEDLVVHQATEHRQCECEVCGELVPEGFLAIRHAFQEHKRSEYVRAYDASSDDIRKRETLVETIGERVDIDEVVAKIENGTEPPAVSAD